MIMLEKNNWLTSKLKWLFYNLICKARKPLLPKHYKFEHEFFEKIKSESYCDSSFMEIKLRKMVHALDKTLVFESYKKREVLCSLITETVNQVQQHENYDIATVSWAKSVLDIHHKRLGGEEASGQLLGEFEHKDFEILTEIIKCRRSIRSFKNEPIERDVLRRILKAGLWAPTGCNRQTVEYLVLEDKDDIRFCQRIAGEGYSFPAEAPLTVVILIDPRGYSLPRQRHMAFLEGGAAAQNILLTAYSLGIGSCWLFWDNHNSAYTDFIQKFSLEPWLLPVAMICLGYPDKVPAVRPERKGLAKCLHWPKPGSQTVRLDSQKLAIEKVV